MDLKTMTDQELVQAYLGYEKWMQTKEIGPDDYGGYFFNLLGIESDMAPHMVKMEIVLAGMELLGEIASRWLKEKIPNEGMDMTGDAANECK